MDGTGYKLARGLLDELSVHLGRVRAGHPAFAVVHPGGMVPMYGCDLAAVRLARIDPSPLGNNMRATVCGNTLANITLEMVVDRCYATPPDNAMPTLAVLDSYARDLADDAAAMRAAAMCFRQGTPATQLGAWTPRGPAGGIHGGAMLTTIPNLDLGCACNTIAWPVIDDQVAPLPGDPRTTG